MSALQFDKMKILFFYLKVDLKECIVIRNFIVVAIKKERDFFTHLSIQNGENNVKIRKISLQKKTS